MSDYSMQTSSFGKPIAVYNRFKVLEDSTKLLKSGEVIYSGRPVTIEVASGSLISMASNMPVYGLAKAQSNPYQDEVFGASTGMYGSGCLTTIVNGIVDLQHNTFTLNDGSEVVVKTYDSAQTYHVWDPLYVELADGGKIGEITNVVVAGNNKTLLGYVLIPPTMTGGSTTMQIYVQGANQGITI